MFLGIEDDVLNSIDLKAKGVGLHNFINITSRVIIEKTFILKI